MTTKRALVVAALGELGMGDYAFDATPEEYEDGRKRLDRIAAQWDGQTIRVGYNLAGTIDSDSGIPDTCDSAFILALACNWAKTFGKAVSQDLRTEAAAAWNAMYVSLGKMPTAVMPSSMPYGTGSRYLDPLMQQYFPESDGTVEGL